jgi:hypothetical protein
LIERQHVAGHIDAILAWLVTRLSGQQRLDSMEALCLLSRTSQCWESSCSIWR